MRKPILYVLPVFATIACTGTEPLPGQFGEDEDTVCVLASTEAVAADATVTIGSIEDEQVDVVVSEVVAGVGDREAVLTWATDGAETPVSFTGSGDASTAELRHYEPATEEIPASMCGTQLAFALTGTLSTADGRLDEAFTTTAGSFGDAVYVDVLMTEPSGSIDPDALAVGSEDVEPDAVDLHLVLRDGGSIPFAGSVSPVRTDDPNEDVAPLGSWPGEIEE